MIEASFEQGRGRSAAVSGAYQYDTGQRLRMYGLPGPDELAQRDELLSGELVAVQAQFGFAGDSQTETRLAQYDEASGAWVAAIPDTYRTQSRDVHVYVYVSYGQTEEASRAKTCYEAVFRPISRPAPGDAVTPDQVNAWDALVQEINLTLATVNTAISGANAAAERANEQSGTARTAAQEAAAAAETARAAGEAVETAWKNATVSAETLEPGDAATVTISESDGVKHLTYGIPRGRDGERGPQGPQGETGPAGVTFTLSGTTLYIDTDT